MLAQTAVLRALRRCRVVAHDEPATAEVMSNGMDRLNELLSYLGTNGTAAWVDLKQGDTLPTPPEHDLNVILALSRRCAATEAGEDPDPAASDMAEQILLAAYMPETTVTVDQTLLTLPSERLRGFIY